MTLESEVQSLRQVPMFREIDPARLKLLAFTSERVGFAPGQRFFSQGDASDAAYVILVGKAQVVLDLPAGAFKIAELGTNDIVGEMGILSDTPRSASVIAEGVSADVDRRHARTRQAPGAHQCPAGGKFELSCSRTRGRNQNRYAVRIGRDLGARRLFI
jgi:hypothetical protein